MTKSKKTDLLTKEIQKLELALKSKKAELLKVRFLEVGDVLVQPCVSSVLTGIGYNKKTQLLGVVLRGGKMYFYQDVPWVVYGGLVLADSKGQYYNREIKSKFKRVD